MPDNSVQLLNVLVATYEKVGDAETDLKAVRALYQKLGSWYNFDAAIVSRNKKGKVRIDKSYEGDKRHSALMGLGFGLAAGLAAAAFPPIGIGAALGAGGVGGAAIGAVVGHVQAGIPRDDLRRIADQLQASTTAVIVVYEAELTDQLDRNIRTVNRVVSRIAELRAEEITDELMEAHV